MRNIWKSNRKEINVVNIIWTSIYIILLVLVIGGINNTSNLGHKQEEKEVISRINKAVTLCYATEGAYPANIDYLSSNYGLDIDEKNYIVHYEIFASNIPPEVKVFRKN